MEKVININIWDDYYEDGHVPEGKVQETFAYVESELSEDESKEALEFLMKHIQTKLKENSNIQLSIDLYDSKAAIESMDEMFFFKRWQIFIKNMTHLQREDLVIDLASDKLFFNSKEIIVYSES